MFGSGPFLTAGLTGSAKLDWDLLSSLVPLFLSPNKLISLYLCKLFEACSYLFAAFVLHIRPENRLASYLPISLLEQSVCSLWSLEREACDDSRSSPFVHWRK